MSAPNPTSESSREVSAVSELDHETAVSRLAAGNKSSSSWLSRISADVLKVLSPEVVASIQSTIDATTLSVQHQPVLVPSLETAPSAPPATATGSMLSNEDMAKFKKLISGKTEISVPSHFISAETPCGTMNMTSEDEARLSALRKDTRSQAGLEQSLRFINRFIREHPKVSESSIINSLHSVLPLETLKNLELLRIQKNSLSQIFSFLQVHYGTLKTPGELYQSLNILTSAIGEDDPLKTLEKVSQLLLQVSEGGDECSKGALRESLKYLKLVLSPESHLMLIYNLKNGTFSDLLSLCKGEFSEMLMTRYRMLRSEQRKMRKLEVKPQSDIVTVPVEPSENPPLSSEQIPDTDSIEMVEIIRQIVSTMHPQKTPLICFQCDKEGHYARHCPENASKRTNPSQPKKNSQSFPKPPTTHFPQVQAPYNQLRCFFHPSAKHTNGECHHQQGQGCATHHGHHSQADCRRSEFPAQPTKPNTHFNTRPNPNHQPWSGPNQTWSPSQPNNQAHQAPPPAWIQPNHGQWRPQPQPLLPQPRVPQPMGNPTTTLPPPGPFQSAQPQQVRQMINQGPPPTPLPQFAQAPEGFRAELWRLMNDWGLNH